MTNSSGRTVTLREWLADEIDNRYEVTRVDSFYLDTEDSKELVTRMKNTPVTGDRNEYIRSVADYVAEAYKKGRERK